MTTTLEKVREKIISLVPEIVELKFGCEVRMTDKGNETLPSDFMFTDGVVGRDYKVWRGESYVKVIQMHDWINKGYYKIIGRPITLEDVLRAHCTMFDWFGDRPLEYRIGKTGQYEEQVASIYNLWHLGKPLEEQSDELKAFVGKVLGV